MQEPSAPRPPLADCHTHLDQYEPGEVPEILSRARAAGVGLIIAAGTTMASCRRTVELSQTHSMVCAGVGLHPMDLTGPIDDATKAALRAMATQPKVMVWSETGLDYLPASPAWETQLQAFRAQINLARELELPLVVHSREAHEDLLKTLREESAQDVGGVFHYFQGELATAHAAMELGFYISLAKPLLRLPELQQVAAQLPLERIVLETDSYPQSFKKYRERWTEPHHLPQVAQKLAELQHVTAEHIAEVTTANLLGMLKGKVSLQQLEQETSMPGGQPA
jgi:TatD DNase family protein